jgi:hypothetical protein
MKTSQTVYLSSMVSSITGISPFTLTIDPIDVENLLTGTYDKKIYNIVYDFGDGTIVSQPASIFSNGDKPTLYPKTHTYNLKIAEATSFQVNVFLYQVNSETPARFTSNVRLKAPSLEASSAVNDNNMFESIHLVGTRMFGTDNNILYMFQSKNPDYLLPVILNWASKELVLDEIQEVVREFIPDQRAFRLLMPFENELVTSIELGASIATVNRHTYFDGEWPVQENPDNADI